MSRRQRKSGSAPKAHRPYRAPPRAHEPAATAPATATAPLTADQTAVLEEAKAGVLTPLEARADLDWALEAQKKGQEALFNAVYQWRRRWRKAEGGEHEAAVELDKAFGVYLALTDQRIAASRRLREVVGHAAEPDLVTTKTTLGPEEHARLQRVKAERLRLVVAGMASALESIRVTLETLEAHPELFGSAEACELQTMTLVSLRHLLWGNEQGAVQDARESFTTQVNGEPYNGPLFALLRDEGMLGDLPRLLGDFARWMAQQYPPKGALLQEPAPALAEAPPDAPAASAEANAR